MNPRDLRGTRWPAPAKLNLFLHVTGRRADGYHELQTLFQLLDWGDAIEIEATDDGSIHRLSGDYGVAEQEDLAVRAAALLQCEAGVRAGARLRVHKHVPMGAGLGGGSSDAATVLCVLNRLWACGLGDDDLAGLGARLGADVPVFVRGHSALAVGVGERLEPVELGARHYLLVFPGLAISTREVFADPDLKRDSRPISRAEALAGGGRNDCDPVVRRRYPRVAEVMDALAPWGRPTMTGTGSAIFLRMASQEQANSAAREIKTLYNVRAVSGVDRSPLHRVLDTAGP
ncbi:MAG: 4-(cytidine 5'-diphospho)-2-C-methyl-D-erythritol kinase [Xanthomonadales bacterium]|nr:4-(cytidine 5'-diphospho)-2-C-methyl-D-erythritol kinase [Xanthomonadales bacterium]